MTDDTRPPEARARWTPLCTDAVFMLIGLLMVIPVWDTVSAPPLTARDLLVALATWVAMLPPLAFRRYFITTKAWRRPD